MLASSTRVLVVAFIVGLVIVLSYEHSLPSSPVTDAVYTAAGAVGVVVAGIVEYLWKRKGKTG